MVSYSQNVTFPYLNGLRETLGDLLSQLNHHHNGIDRIVIQVSIRVTVLIVTVNYPQQDDA